MNINKQRKVNWLLILGLVIISTSCKKLPILESKFYSSEAYFNEFFDYYDAENKIRYEFYNDDNYFYLKLDTYNQLSKMKILSSGLRIVFDTLQKKNQEQYIQYPLTAEERTGDYEKEDVLKQYDKGSRMQDIINMLPKQAKVFSYSGEKEFNIVKDTADILIKIYEDKSQNLVYEAKFSLETLLPEDFDKSKSFSFGIVSGKLDLPDQDNRSANHAPPSTSNNYNARANYRAESNMQAHMNAMRNEITKPIQIWCKTNLSTEIIK